MLAETMLLLKDILFFVAYVSRNQSFPLQLPPEEEAELLRKWVEYGDERAKMKLIEHNMRLVAFIAKKYVNSGYDMDDLISTGTVGLVKAVNTYDAGRAKTLSAYTSRCIENEILMLLRSDKKRRNDVSLQDPIGVDSEGNELTLADVLGQEDGMLEKVELRLQGTHLGIEMRKHLNHREQVVITLRYGLVDGRCMTQREVAQRLGISRSYVSRLEKHAIEKLCKVFME